MGTESGTAHLLAWKSRSREQHWERLQGRQRWEAFFDNAVRGAAWEIFFAIPSSAGFPKMHERCPVCGLRFEREPGYFLGAMYISYALGLAIIAIIAALLWSITGWWITKDTIWAVVLFLPLAPTVTLFARVLWIYLDQTIDPERP